jgi:hypothetical protein
MRALVRSSSQAPRAPVSIADCCKVHLGRVSYIISHPIHLIVLVSAAAMLFVKRQHSFVQ